MGLKNFKTTVLAAAFKMAECANPNLNLKFFKSSALVTIFKMAEVANSNLMLFSTIFKTSA